MQRAGVILSAAKGMNNTQIAQKLQLARNTVRTWRQRWLAAVERLRSVEAEGISDKELLQMMAAILADAPRPGTPATFTTEQVVQIIALACESPHCSERPVSHWTTQELVSVRNEKVFSNQWKAVPLSCPMPATVFVLFTSQSIPLG
jgi:putative transposase